MPDPYESELIGCFLVALGFVAGDRKTERPIIVNCLQQSPWDKYRGDMMTGCNAFLALEFKRYLEPDEEYKERVKWKRDKLLGHFLGEPDRITFANRHHFYVYGDRQGKIAAQPFLPVLLRLNKPDTETEQNSPARWHTELEIDATKALELDDLVKMILDGRAESGSVEQVSNYLDDLEEFREAVQGAQGSGGSGGPALLAVLIDECGTVVVSTQDGLKDCLNLQLAKQSQIVVPIQQENVVNAPQPETSAPPPEANFTPSKPGSKGPRKRS